MVANSINGAITSNSATKSLGQQDFLRLMVAQIQHQDPTSFQVNNEGVNQMQESMQQMANSLQSNQALQASALVGRKVMIPNDQLTLDNAGDPQISIDIPSDPSILFASIYSESGKLLKRISLAHAKPGLFHFSWDGTNEDCKRLADGTYKLEVRGVFGGEESTLKTMTFANVDSVSFRPNEEGLTLNVAGIGPVAFNQVRQITV